jgi:hypothetical protein
VNPKSGIKKSFQIEKGDRKYNVSVWLDPRNSDLCKDEEHEKKIKHDIAQFINENSEKL